MRRPPAGTLPTTRLGAQGLVEYALVLALVAVGSVAALLAFGGTLDGLYAAAVTAFAAV